VKTSSVHGDETMRDYACSQHGGEAALKACSDLRAALVAQVHQAGHYSPGSSGSVLCEAS